MVLDDVLVLELAQELDFPLECAQHSLFTFLIYPRSRRQRYLLDGHQKPSRGVHPEIHLTERSSADECTLDPFDGFLYRSGRRMLSAQTAKNRYE